jgi:hypothetical protein
MLAFPIPFDGATSTSRDVRSASQPNPILGPINAIFRNSLPFPCQGVFSVIFGAKIPCQDDSLRIRMLLIRRAFPALSRIVVHPDSNFAGIFPYNRELLRAHRIAAPRPQLPVTARHRARRRKGRGRAGPLSDAGLGEAGAGARHPVRLLPRLPGGCGRGFANRGPRRTARRVFRASRRPAARRRRW